MCKNDCIVSTVSDIHYPQGTDPRLIQLLDILKRDMRQTRVIIHYSAYPDTDAGYIGRTTGTCKAPLIVHNARSLGGSIINTAGVSLVTTSTKPYDVLYRK